MKSAAPAYPGAPVMLTSMVRNGEFGDVRVQEYGPGQFRVCQFLPGIVVELPGDTPKVEPEVHRWVDSFNEAQDTFVLYVNQAHAAGWEDTDAD